MTPTVTLRNGAEEHEPTVRAIILNLELLMSQEPIAFYELVCVCRDPGHQIFGNCGTKLQDRDFLDGSGRPFTTVRNVVLSSVAGDDMMYQSPFMDA